MGRGGKFTGTVAMLAVAACGGGQGKLQIRPTPTPFAAGERPVPLRVAEARGQLALGNVALALEAFRKASREDPNSIEALAGMAECYDRMGRYDLSRRNYEAALALAPGNFGLLGALAASLEVQGLREEAREVLQEIAARSASAREPDQVAAAAPEQVATIDPTAAAQTAVALAPKPTAEAQPSVPQAEPVVALAAPSEKIAAVAPPPPPPEPEPVALVGRSVTIKLPPARPAPQPTERTPVERAPETAVATRNSAPREQGPRLERLSMGEIALVTTAGPMWRPTTVERSARSTKVRFVPLREASAQPVRVRLLNAARVHRLAARTRTYLAGRGWRGMTIGDAPATRSRSLILYPANKREFARKLSAQFGFAMAPRASGAQVTVLLGRDAARLTALRPARA